MQPSEADAKSLPQKLLDDLAAKRAESEAQSDFAPANVDGIAERAVQAHARERKSGGREKSEKDGAQAVFGEPIGEVLLERREIVGGAQWFDVAKLVADGFGHGHGSVAGAHEEVGARLGDGRAPVGGGNGSSIEAGFAGVAGDADDFGRAGIAQVHGLHVMADHGLAVEIGVGEGAIDDDGGRSVGFAANLAGKQRDAHGGEVTGGDEAIVGDELGFALSAAFEELEFGLIFEGHAGYADGDGGGFDARGGAQSFEDAVGELAQFFHVAGFAPVHAELKGKYVAGIKAA